MLHVSLNCHYVYSVRTFCRFGSVVMFFFLLICKWSDICNIVQADDSSCTDVHMTCPTLINQMHPVNLAVCLNCKTLTSLQMPPLRCVSIAACYLSPTTTPVLRCFSHHSPISLCKHISESDDAGAWTPNSNYV